MKRLNPNGARLLAHIFDDLRFGPARPLGRLGLKHPPRRESTTAGPSDEPESEPEPEPDESDESDSEPQHSTDSDAATISDDDTPLRGARTGRGKGAAAAKAQPVAKAKAKAKAKPKPKTQAARRPRNAAAVVPDDVPEKAMCVSYVPVTSCVDPPRSIVDKLPENATRAMSNKNLYDALCILKPGPGVCEPSNMNLGTKRKNTAAYYVAAAAYEREFPTPPTGDFYIILRSAIDPLQYSSADPKQSFVKVTGRFQTPGTSGHFRLPSSLLNLLGKIFVVKGNNTVMKFTDVSTGSPGHGYKFDVRGPIDGTPSFAFMVEVKAQMQRGYVVPGPASALRDAAPGPASALRDAAPAPAPPAPPAPAPPPDELEADLEADLEAELEAQLEAELKEAEEPQQPEEEVEDMEINEPDAAPLEVPLEPSPVNENDFWNIHKMSDIRSSVFRRIELSKKTSDAFDVAFSRYYESRRTDPPVNMAQVVDRIVADMQAALRS
jgi:hypothetical protein